MLHKPLWHVHYETRAVSERYVAADTVAQVMAAITAIEQAHHSHAVTVHFNEIKRLGTVALP